MLWCLKVDVRPMRSLPRRKSCAIRSHLSAVTNHGKTFFDILVMLTNNRPGYLPGGGI
jgi:hypothetical protein